MRIFLDSADPAEIREFSRWRILDGITTTPTFFSRLGINNAREAIGEMAAQFPGEIHVEAMGLKPEEIIQAARENHELGPHIVSKIPIGPAGLEAVNRLKEEGIATNLHLIFSVNQAMLAAKAGASYVCPLMGRMNDVGLGSSKTITDMVQALALHRELSTIVMVSSLRNPEDARKAFLTGAGAITVPGRILRQMVASPLTDKACNILAEDYLATSTVSQLMHCLEDLPVLSPSSMLREAMLEMTVKGIGITAVVEDNRVVGVVTDGDLRRAFKRTLDNQDASLETIMNTTAKHVGPDDEVRLAVELMSKYRITELLVLGATSEPLGFLNLHDLMLPKPTARFGLPPAILPC